MGRRVARKNPEEKTQSDVTLTPVDVDPDNTKEEIEEDTGVIIEDTDIDDSTVDTDIDDAADKALSESSEDTSIVVDTTVVEVEVPKKMVKVLPNSNHRFFYGKSWYYLTKDVEIFVPEEVKRVLQRAGKLKAL